jgi:hypothetical protein
MASFIENEAIGPVTQRIESLLRKPVYMGPNPIRPTNLSGALRRFFVGRSDQTHWDYDITLYAQCKRNGYTS